MSDTLPSIGSPFIGYLGLELLALEAGVAEYAVDLRPELTNRVGLAHGGLLASLADSAAGTAVFNLLPADRVALTSDFNMTCFKSISEGRLYARANVVHRGRRFMRSEVEIRSDSDLLARVGVSFMVVERR